MSTSEMSAVMALPPATFATEPDAPAPTTRPRWGWPALVALLVGTAILYLAGLSASGWANSYYSAAVQAGTQSWKAMFFGSLDAGNYITVDKPPASLWLMDLSGRIFGFSSWSMLVPQALLGVGTVALVYAAVRRHFGDVAGLVAGAATALTPVAVLMFRFNNPDALLTFLLTLAAYATVRALADGRTRWLVLAGTAIGFAFLTKMLQAFLVLPGLGLAYLVCAPVALRTRLWQLAAAVGTLVASAGWWVAIVELWPASSRPYIGGSTNNSVLELAFGYNGLSRITGAEGGPGGGSGGGPGGAGFGGATGLFRMFGSEFGTEISWLLPAAMLALGLGFVLARRQPRTSPLLGALILWGGWLVVTALVFSYMAGIIHPYYTVALAPPIGALVAIVGRELWRERSTFGRAGLAALIAVAAGWSVLLLGRVDWQSWLRPAIVVLALVAIAAVLAPLLGRRLAIVGAAAVGLTTVAALLGTAAFAVATASTPHSGSLPVSGPAGVAATNGGAPGAQTGGPPGTLGARLPGRLPGGPAGLNGNPPGPLAGGGAPGGAVTINQDMVALLQATSSRWAAATSGAQSAASLELATGRPVLGLGGFSGNDPSPTLAQFQAWVAAGDVRYFIGGVGRGGEIASWVAANYTATTVGNMAVYDLAR